jgi:hypothetical protein
VISLSSGDRRETRRLSTNSSLPKTLGSDSKQTGASEQSQEGSRAGTSVIRDSRVVEAVEGVPVFGIRVSEAHREFRTRHQRHLQRKRKRAGHAID